MWRRVVEAGIAWGLLVGAWENGYSQRAMAEQLDVDLTTKGNPAALIKFVGPNVQSATELTDDGLVVRLPTDKPGRPQVGVETRFWVTGDFEITGEYEIVKMEKPSKGYGLGVLLRVIKDSQPGQRGFLSRFMHRQHGSVYSTNISTATEQGMKNDEQYHPTAADCGQLKLKREGSVLHFLVAEGDESEFRELRSEDFGAEDLKTVGFLADTGGAPEHVEVVLRKLSVRGEALSFAMPPRRRRAIGIVWIVTTVVAVIVLCMGGFIVLLRRRR